MSKSESHLLLASGLSSAASRFRVVATCGYGWLGNPVGLLFGYPRPVLSSWHGGGDGGDRFEAGFSTGTEAESFISFDFGCALAKKYLGLGMFEFAPPFYVASLSSPWSFQEVHFHCPVSPVKSEEECMGPNNGHCRAGSKCYIKNNLETKQAYAVCCCDQSSTPVNMIEKHSSNWSCFAEHVRFPTETRGRPSFCSIHCCQRQGQAKFLF